MRKHLTDVNARVPALPLKFNTHTKLLAQCKKCCDWRYVSIRDLLKGSGYCRKCANEVSGVAANLAVAAKARAYLTDYERRLSSILSGAKKRCENPKSAGFKNYGGRGVEFKFISLAVGVAHLITLPIRTKGQTLDRIDNNGHYEEGNLRWADRTTQRLNQREIRRDNKRVTRLHADRPDVSRETIRRWIGNVWSDERILTNRKGSHDNS